MPGLVGYVSEGMERQHALRVLGEMTALATDPVSNVWDAPFCDGTVCAMRSHLGVVQAAPQPYQDDGLYVWMEGEIFNADELPGGQGTVAGMPHGGAGAAVDHGTDTETPGQPGLLARLYRSGGCGGDWGALASIDGVYSAVIYDVACQSVHLVADRLGMRFLHWTLAGGRFAWSSASSAFLALPGFRPSVSARQVEQYLALGHLQLDATWLDGVELVTPGTVLSWDLRAKTLSRDRYWWWDHLKPAANRVDMREAAEELARRFRLAVARRCRPGERVGVSLSGGLDSRAIVAAAPERDEPLATLTFGRLDSLDVRIARRVAAVRGADAHFVEISAANWLAPRLDAVWWSEGNASIIDMHGIEARDEYRRIMNINLDGYGGDNIVRGDYLQGRESLDRFDAGYIARSKHCDISLLDGLEAFAPLGRSEYWGLEASSRRWIGAPLFIELTFMEVRRPFVANDVVEFVYSLPDRCRYRGRLYVAMLLGAFPEYYRHIPWANIGIPIGRPRGAGRLHKVKAKLEQRIAGGVSTPGVVGRGPVHYADHPSWLRAEPARSLVEKLVITPAALHREYDHSGARRRALGRAPARGRPRRRHRALPDGGAERLRADLRRDLPAGDWRSLHLRSRAAAAILTGSEVHTTMTDLPVRPPDRFLVFGAPTIGEEEIAEVVASMRSGWLGSGPKVARFETTSRPTKAPTTPSRGAPARPPCTSRCLPWGCSRGTRS